MSKKLEVNPLCPLEHRLSLLEQMPKNSICAEIGVYEGTFSQKILEICEPKLLFLIDPEPQEIFYYNQQFLEGNFLLYKITLEDAKLQNNYFDWVYLDTTHEFLDTYNQLKICYKKVKRNGFITGDDYFECFNGLQKAVDFFLRQYKNRVSLEYIKDGQYKIRKIK